MNEVIRVDALGREVVEVRAAPRDLLPLPTPGSLGVRVRDAVPGSGDLGFIDALQRKHTKAVGWMPTGQLEGHIAKGHVLVAEAISRQPLAISEESTEDQELTAKGYGLTASPAAPQPVGYCIGVDKYFKREDTGIIYQMNIAPGRQRGLVGATLLKAMFERCPYGVKLFCCWCAQDLAANHFWEAMGFVPLAFRAGSRKRDRVHIFWQKAIRAEDDNGRGPNFQGWWYPSQTGAGALKEDRIVLPIPPGTHWSEAKPRVLPGVAALLEEAAAERKALEGPVDKEARARQREAKKPKKAKAQRAARPAEANAGGFWFGPPVAPVAPESQEAQEPPEQKKQKAAKNDPRLVAAARELRDRWLEKVAAEPGLIEATSGGGSRAKYDVARRIGSDDITMRDALPGAVPEALPGAGVGAGAGNGPPMTWVSAA